MLAYIVPQTVNGREPAAQFLTSVKEIEAETHLDFFHDLPDDQERKLESAMTGEGW